MLDTPSAWFANGEALPGGLSIGQTNIYVGWVAYRFYPEGKRGQYLNDTVPILILTELSGVDGSVIGYSAYEVLPDGILYGEGAIRSVAWRQDGLFAIGHEWFLPNGTYPQRVAVGRVGQNYFDWQIPLPVNGDPGQLAAQTSAAWDGEAFAMEAYGAPPQFSLHVARVDDQGNVVLPFTEYGLADNPPPAVFAYRSSTSPESGRTYSFDAQGKTLLSGHLRDGARLPGTESGPKTVWADSLPTESATMPAVAADAEGAWTAWTQWDNFVGPDPVIVQRVDLDGNAVGGAVRVDSAPFDDLDVIWRWTLLSRRAGVYLLGMSDRSLYRFDYDGDELGKPVRFMGPGEPDSIDPRDLQVIEANGEVWFSYSQNKGGFYIRILKLKDGCSYPAHPASLE